MIAPGFGEVLDRVALGQFQHHLRQFDRRVGKDLAHVLDDALVAEQLAGEIERHFQGRAAADGRARLGADAPHQVARHVADQPARFRQWNEGARQHQRAIRFSPAHQHFRAAQLAGADIHDRLVIGHEFAGRQRALDLGHRIVAAAPLHQQGNGADDQHDGAARIDAEPFQIGLTGGQLPARRHDLRAKTETAGRGLGRVGAACRRFRRLADPPDQGAGAGGDVGIGAERPALGRHLRQEQHGGHQRGDFIGAGFAAQPHHRAAVLEPDDVERIAAGAGQRLRGHQFGLGERFAGMSAERAPIGTDQRDFLHRRGVEHRAPHGLDMAGRAGVHPARRQCIERADDLGHAGFGERNRALGGGLHLLLALPMDDAAEPEIERDQRRAGQQDAGGDRNDVPARETAQRPSHPGVGPQPLLVSWY